MLFPKHVKDDLDAPLEDSVHFQFRGGVGQLQWLQLQGNPLLSFATGVLQSRSATPNGHDLLRPQQVDARSQINAGSLLVDCVSGRPRLSGLQLRMLRGQTDHDGSSTSGHMIMAAHPNIFVW